MTEFGDALKNAIDRKESDITRFSWKKSNGDEELMINMSADDLRKAYKHCHDMLYNTSRNNPGKIVLKKYSDHVYDNCNAELLARYIIYEMNIPTLKSNKALIEFISAFKQQHSVGNNAPVSELFENLPKVFETVTVDRLINSCLGTLDALNKRKFISDKFIVSLGIWLTDAEMKDLTEYNPDGSMRNRLDVIRERLILNNVRLKLTPTGLSFAEFRNLINLKNISKYRDITTDCLRLIRDKISLLVNNSLDYHIEKWQKLMSQIEAVAKLNSITLNENKK